jgi:F-type H+-transporting ATPase subunit epsilon
MATIKVDIVSAEGEIHSGEATMVFAPAKMGEVGIAPRHAPLLTALKPGEVRVQDTEGNEHFFYAQQEAEQALEGASEETDVARAQQELAEARARYRAAQKLKGMK